jgi:hypothetical protein
MGLISNPQPGLTVNKIQLFDNCKQLADQTTEQFEVTFEVSKITNATFNKGVFNF